MGFLRELRKNWELFIMALPGIVLLFLFCYLPMGGIVIAFKNYQYMKGLFLSPWCGLSNFKFLFSTNVAWQITKLTLGYNLIFILLGLILPVTLAILFNEIKNAGLSKIYQTVSIMPHFLSWVVMSYVGLAFLNNNGLLNALFHAAGMKPIDWYNAVSSWPFILVFVHEWKMIGFSSIIYLACICGISPEYYEAARLDGASKWQQIKFITIPELKMMMIITTIMALGRIFNSDFGLFYQMPMNQGQLFPVTETIDVYVFNALQTMNNINMPAAASVFQSIVGFITILIANGIIRKIDAESALF